MSATFLTRNKFCLKSYKLHFTNICKLIINLGEMDYRFHAAHLDRGLTIHEAVPGGFNRAGEGL